MPSAPAAVYAQVSGTFRALPAMTVKHPMHGTAFPWYY